jgi:hypothetical protein
MLIANSQIVINVFYIIISMINKLIKYIELSYHIINYKLTV